MRARLLLATRKYQQVDLRLPFGMRPISAPHLIANSIFRLKPREGNSPQVAVLLDDQVRGEDP
ncbi:hypothetical protein BS297_24145 [Rhodococcus erythropolis]|uniref:Uncharacterized protein n=1 Tax=Rhodococcus erythropolis TaxID=1833 RepID=A0A0C3AB64_RHOER|nr:hypothetical protein BS297_24145 [Rhodococcus erythropolis]KIM17319.1 hypothetical protein QV65_06365 [Rhodococcus erythropolis]